MVKFEEVSKKEQNQETKDELLSVRHTWLENENTIK